MVTGNILWNAGTAGMAATVSTRRKRLAVPYPDRINLLGGYDFQYLVFYIECCIRENLRHEPNVK